MLTVTHSSVIAAPRAEVFAWYLRPGAFERLLPPWETVRIVKRSGGVQDGGLISLQLRKGPLWLSWDARHFGFEDGRTIADEQVRGPFRSWRHTRTFADALGGAACELTERVEVELPLGLAVAGGSIGRSIERMLRFRHRRMELDLARHQTHAQRPPLRVVIGGASGLVGSQFSAFLATGGHTVVRLVRSRSRPGEIETPTIPWDPARGALDAASLAAYDAVVHFGGVTIAKRFTAAHKDAVRRSRIESTRLLSETIARLTHKPRVFIVASAIGYYGDRGDAWVDESSGRGLGFRPDVCEEWERAADAARAAGVRVVHARLGVVLSASGGALRAMLPAFRGGVGGVIGSGHQFMSWIALEDAIGALHHLLFTEEIDGPVNVTAPEPVTNREFTKALGRVLHRPTVLPLPATAVKLVLGEMGKALLLDGCRARPRVLENSRYRFAFGGLEDALRWELCGG